jgi:hypothetical protein
VLNTQFAFDKYGEVRDAANDPEGPINGLGDDPDRRGSAAVKLPPRRWMSRAASLVPHCTSMDL